MNSHGRRYQLWSSPPQPWSRCPYAPSWARIVSDVDVRLRVTPPRCARSWYTTTDALQVRSWKRSDSSDHITLKIWRQILLALRWVCGSVTPECCCIRRWRVLGWRVVGGELKVEVRGLQVIWWKALFILLEIHQETDTKLSQRIVLNNLVSHLNYFLLAAKRI